MRIVSANVLFDHPSPARFGEVIAKLSPDIIVTQEAKFKWPDVLRALPDFPYLVGPEISKWNGNLVLSRYPLRARLVPDMPPSGYSLGGGIRRSRRGRSAGPRAAAGHLRHPCADAAHVCRLEGAQPLSRCARRADCGRADGHARSCLRGDWNTPVWSPAYGRTLRLSGLEATERSAWPPPTRFSQVAAGINLGTPIDHFAVSGGIAVADLFTGPDFGSDHLPVVADLKLP